MNAAGKSDESVVPPTQVNKAGTEPAAESAEGRDSAKRNAEQADLHRSPKRNKRKSLGLFGVRTTARAEPELFSRSTQGRSRMSRSSSTDLCGGWPERAIPTAILR